MTVFPNLQNIQVLVVGASQGIGLGFVRYLLEMDTVAQVCATYRNPATASDLLHLAQSHPQRLHCLSMDVTDEEQIIRALAEIQTATHRLHLVINCVGFLHDADIQPEKSLKQIESDQLIRYFQVNSISAILLAKHLAPLLSHNESNIFATISAKIGSIGDNRLGGWYGYRASKAALNMFLKTASIEYSRKSKHTTIVMLHPGTTDTRLSKPFQRGVPAEKLFSVEKTVRQLIAVLAKVTPADNGAFLTWDGSRLPW